MEVSYLLQVSILESSERWLILKTGLPLLLVRMHRDETDVGSCEFSGSTVA